MKPSENDGRIPRVKLQALHLSYMAPAYTCKQSGTPWRLLLPPFLICLLFLSLAEMYQDLSSRGPAGEKMQPMLYLTMQSLVPGLTAPYLSSRSGCLLQCPLQLPSWMWSAAGTDTSSMQCVDVLILARADIGWCPQCTCIAIIKTAVRHFPSSSNTSFPSVKAASNAGSTGYLTVGMHLR